MTAWSGEELRRGALATLGEHGDERARDALAHASITVAGAAGWDGSAGRVDAHRVTLGLDARTLGGLRATPALVDALCAAVAAAIAARTGETLLDLHLHWAPAAPRSSAGYRDAPPPEHGASLHGALMDYLEGGGDLLLARLVAGAMFDESTPGQVAVTLASSARPAFRRNTRAVATITSALRDLLGDATTRVRVR